MVEFYILLHRGVLLLPDWKFVRLTDSGFMVDSAADKRATTRTDLWPRFNPVEITWQSSDYIQLAKSVSVL